MTVHYSPHAAIDMPRQSLVEFVLDAGRGQAQSPALVDGVTGRVVTYAQLHEQVRRTAAGLAERGIRKGDVIALWSPNSPEFAIAFYGGVTAGATVTLANPTNTAHELAHQLADAGAKMLITIAALADKARAAIAESGRGIELLTTDETPGLPSLTSIARDAPAPVITIDPTTDVVVLPYSSGTTGLPKGVMLTHANIIANLLQIEAVETNRWHALVGVLPFFHIYGLVAVLNFGLRLGAAVVTLPRFDLERFLVTLQSWRIEFVHVVPPIALTLARQPCVDNYDLHHLRCLFSGAAPLSPSVEAELQQRLKIDVRQGYGMTEASPVTHYHDSSSPARPRTVGRLVPATQCRIIDTESGQDAATGQPGEVWLRGPQVMKGYLNNPDATARTVDAEGWLRTGDIGAVDSEGYLTIVDRLKELIKVKGFQVAPAELEDLLLKHPRIADAAVIPVADEECGEVPKALVVRRGEVTETEVIEFIYAQVAHYKRLHRVEFVDTIPKSASGKILRRVLVARERAPRPA